MSRSEEKVNDDEKDVPTATDDSARGMLYLMGGLIHEFTGKENDYPSSQWIQDVEDNSEIYRWTPTQTLLMARRSLVGTAALWLKSERAFKTWKELKEAVLKEFPDTLDMKAIHELMSTRRKKPDESCLDYMLTMKELGKRGKMPDYVAIQYIIDGIPDYETNKIMLYGVKTYPSLKEKLKIYENMKEKIKKRPVKIPSVTPSSSTQFRGNTAVRCYNCGEKNHISSECPSKNQGRKCFNCNEFGHLSANCTSRREFSKMAAKPRNDMKSDSHSKQKQVCFSSETSGGNIENEDCDCNVGSMMMAAANQVPSVPCFHVGSTDCSGKMAASTQCHKCQNIDFGVNNRANIREKQKKPVKMVKISSENSTSALVDSGSDVNLLSIDFYEQIGSPKCDVNKNITLCGLGLSKVTPFGHFSTCIEIDGYKYDDVRFYVVPRDCIPFTMSIILGHEFLCKVITVMKDGSVWMKPNDWLCKLDCFPCSADFVGHIADEGVKDEVAKLVENYQPHQTKEAPIELKIMLKDEMPVAQRPRRVAPKEQEEVDHQIKEWLEQGIIRVSFSEYASPLVLVRKKDGSLRVCVDYRLLNRKILKDEYPLPIIDDHIDKLPKARVFTALDLKNGFFHLRVHEESIKYTSFVTQNGQYEFLRAPFGLATCPKVFTRFISIIFRDLITRGIVIVFIDDLLIPANDELEALERLREVLQTAAEYGLQINWTKSQLLVRKVEFLGHVIEEGVVMPSPGKTDAVIKFPEPRNEKQLHSFLGLCSYFRKFIENYAFIAQPLTDMLRKDVKFEFNDEHRMVFNMLKKKLTSKPILKIYDPKAETELHTDASSIAYAAILMQKDSNGDLHPIHYMSRRTTDAESRYTSYELEALAIIEGVKKFRHYLFGKHFKIVTDCKAFQMTLNKKDLAMSTKIARWIIILQDYDFTIEHREGTKMRHVDALSRNPYVGAIFSDLHSDLRHAQECDDGLRAIIEILKEEKPYNDFYLHEGLLCKGLERRLVVPQNMETEIIRKAHENGHFAKKKTIELISKDYYIPKLGKKVEDYIATCIPCLLATRKEGRQEGFLNPIEKGDTPLHTLHIDHIGPLTDTRKQYNHILTVIDAFTKFVWLFPTKSTTTQEVINKMEIHQQNFGNPARIISDKGTAFTSNDFAQYCERENIQHIKITTGVPRGNGQVERVHRTIISVITKLTIANPTLWYKQINRVQRALNSTYQRSINTTPFELLIGTKMRNKEDIELLQLLAQEERNNYDQNREDLRKIAKEKIFEIQEENRRNYDKKRKESSQYKEGDIVAIKRTQFGTGMKLKPKFLGPYKVAKVKRNNRYDVEKIDSQAEGPNKTSTSSDNMKSWPDYTSD